MPKYLLCIDGGDRDKKNHTMTYIQTRVNYIMKILAETIFNCNLRITVLGNGLEFVIYIYYSIY